MASSIVLSGAVGEWLDNLSALGKAAEEIAWMFVDELRRGIETYGTDRNTVADLYDLASEATGLHPKTLRNYVSIARSFPPDRRTPGLSLGHANAVLGAEREEQERLLDTALAQGWSVDKLRRERFFEGQENGLPDVRELCCPQCGHEWKG